MKTLVPHFLFPVIFLSFLLQACVAVQSFPAAARAGDTITLAVGSPEGMNRTNTSAQFVSDIDAAVFDLPIRSVIRIRPDPTSKAALFNEILNAEDSYTGHSQWLTLLVIDLPDNLPAGTGVININSAASYGTLPVGINDIPVSLEILEGRGASNPFKYNTGFNNFLTSDLNSLEALPQAVFRVADAVDSTTQFAAAEIKTSLPLDSVPDRAIRVVADDFYSKNPKKQLQMNWARNANELTVNFISPAGGIRLRQLRFSVVLRPGVSFISGQAPQIISVKLFDRNGELKYIVPGKASEEFFVMNIE
ncbi:MAG TPA: hypothetical protein ENI98_10870 [Gammaproteobacteria bacterium]|nr:hypothetical protein [Gammaproteobacteria bacterium]